MGRVCRTRVGHKRKRKRWSGPVWDLYTWQEVVLLLVVVAVVKVGICGRRQMQQRWVSLWNWSTDIDGLPEVIILEVKSPWECLCLKILEQILFTWVFLTALVLRLFIRLCRACHWHIFMVNFLLPLSKVQIGGWSTWQHVMMVTMQLLLTTLGPTVDVGISVCTYCHERCWLFVVILLGWQRWNMVKLYALQ